MDTARLETNSCTLPPPRDLLLSTSHQPQSSGEDIVDKMAIDEHFESPEQKEMPQETKPHLPSITNMQQYSPMPQPAPSEEYVRHRLSDMSVNPPPSHRQSPCLSPAHEPPPAPGRNLSPLEPLQYDSYSRRGSTVDYEYRRPSITELNNLPLPTTASAAASRRGSLATVTDYDYSSRSPSPAPFIKSRINHDEKTYYSSAAPGNPNRRDSLPIMSYDSFQRRHSIATAEPSYQHPQPARSNLVPSKHRAFQFPSTIHETPNGPYSAPSSPPQAPDAPADGSTKIMATAENRYARHGVRHASSSGTDHHLHYQQQQQQQQQHQQAQRQQHQRTSHHPYAANGVLLHHRRKSILNDNEEAPSLGRRASMPVVTMRHKSTNGSDLYPQREEMYLLEETKPARKSETPYSRSPELRVSHKLAERKRRKEMKELFDELRDSLPVEKNLKTSKWEILSKAVEYISVLKRRDYELESEINVLRREVATLKRERGGTNHYGGPAAPPF
ncbi:hypothetical protein EC973_003836 [Apophysomyces ossiformis]|uniref:BHLH domain-containing protein n=1 Tax=Apophysomyces ossiformis TaxID=679940 RepID=A0A8H7BXV2_9FUNG|nr:hypothetical protein EC973_003836 [Apophysomyces ossiformis]